MAKTDKTIKKSPEAGPPKTAFKLNYPIIAGILSAAGIVLGISMFFFGRGLQDPVFAGGFTEYIKSLNPSPANLNNFGYKVNALSSLSLYFGTFTAIISVIILYLTIKGINLWRPIKEGLKRYYDFIGGRAGLKDFCFILGSSILALIFFILVISAGGFFVHIPITRYHLPAALILSILYIWFCSGRFFKDNAKKVFLVSVTAFALLLLGSYILGGAVYDTAFDSQAYHQETIIMMANGWNPVYMSDQVKAEKMVDWQAKACETCETTVFKTFGKAENGKLFNFLLIAASFLISIAAILAVSSMPLIWALMISSILAFNPISVYQCFSYYVDGQFSSLLIAMIGLVPLIMMNQRLIYTICLGISVVIAAGIKLTGIPYAGILGIVIVGGMAAKKKFKEGALLSIMLSFFMIFGLFIVNFNPYVTNYIHHGHIFHPFMGKNVMSVQNHGPQYITTMNSAQKVFASVFSESENFYVGRLTEVNYKIPFTVSDRELAVFMNTDPRIGGFGPLFGGAIIIGLIIFLAMLRYDPKVAGVLGVALFFAGASVIVNPEPWWARFVPQLWVLPVMSLIACHYRPNMVVNILRNLLAAVLILNIVMVSGVYVTSQIVTSMSLSAQLSEVRSDGRRIYAFFPFFSTSLGRRLTENNIKYKEVSQNYFKEQPKVIAADFSTIYYMQDKP